MGPFDFEITRVNCITVLGHLIRLIRYLGLYSVSGPVVHSEDLEDAIENKSTVSSESSELRARKPASQPPCTLRDSGPYATVDPVRPHGNVRAICVSTELSDFPSHDVYSVLLPRSCSV